MFQRSMSKFSAVLFGLIIGTAPAFAALSGTATIFGVPDGSNYDYTIVLTNPSGSAANIGTFWFAWTPPGDPIEYDFLPSVSTPTGQPAGWVGVASAGFPGNSVEYYNVSGSLIAPGQTGTFLFTSPDSPATLQGTSLGFPITDSFIYTVVPTTPGVAPVGTFAQVLPVFIAAPEPSSMILLAVGCLGTVCLRRRKTSV
jgi:hypothetical protein